MMKNMKRLAALALVLAMLAGFAAAESLPDGSYIPDEFSFSGGTGKVELSCAELKIANGQAWASIRFSSPNYGYVKVNGEKYLAASDGENSTFEVPVALNQMNEIIGMTTAMTADHEISYDVWIYLAASDTGANGDAPQEARIPGLRFVAAEENTRAELFRIYRYEGGYTLIRIADAGACLLIPEGEAVPEGLTDISVIHLPVQSACGASAEILGRMDALGISRERMIDAGSFDAPNYQALLLDGCDLAILPEAFVTDSALAAVMERLGMLGIPALVDRSADEADEEGSLEWMRVYGAIFGCEEAASAICARIGAE